MISTWPMVRRLNRCQSSGIRQGMSFPAPITPLRATAAIADDLGHDQTAIGALIPGCGS